MRIVGFCMLVLLFCGAGEGLAAPQGQVAFFNHSFAILDSETADAIAHSDYLRRFGVFEVRTTVANGGEKWTGRYLSGRQTYLELFGPKDLEGAGAGSTGLAVSPDRIGGLAILKGRLLAGGMAKLDTARRTRKMGEAQVPWFDFVAPPGDPATLSTWAMEYLSSFLADPRTGKGPAAFAGDVSRKRYQSNDYEHRLMRDVSGVEIAATAEDIASARAVLAAAGFQVSRDGKRLDARDADTAIVLDAAPAAQAGMRRIVFVLNAPARTVHIERLGHSTLTVGPGRSAIWLFDPRR
jgi:Family of unknown function (DUF5829)